MSDDRLAYYETTFTDLRERLIRVLGAPTVNRLVDRAIAEVQRSHPAIQSFAAPDGEDEMSFDAARIAFAEATDEQIRDAFTAFNSVLLLVVARLLGKEIALRLTEGLSVSEYLQRGGLR
jgi:hypothetical protein